MLRRGRAAAGQNARGGLQRLAASHFNRKAPLRFSYGRHRRADPADRAVFPGTAAQCREHRGRLPAAGVNAALAVWLCHKPHIAENAAHHVRRIVCKKLRRGRCIAVVVRGCGSEIRQITAPVSGREQLAAELLVTLQNEHRAGFFHNARSGAGGHQAGCTAADYCNIHLFHCAPQIIAPSRP